MGYRHYGEIGDIWKHLPLCSVLKIEKPLHYIESNSASAEYTLSHTPEQEYGIYHLLYGNESPLIGSSEYVKLINRQNRSNPISKYVGSSVQGYLLLNEFGSDFSYYDIDESALNDLESYLSSINKKSTMIFHNRDSVSHIWSNIDSYEKETFIHFDPYDYLEKNDEELSFVDVFLRCVEKGLKCFFWYGFSTKNQQRFVHDEIRALLENKDIGFDKFHGYDIYLNSILDDEEEFNPGIMGCGILTGNLSWESDKIIKSYQLELVEVYKGKLYDERYDGSLGMEIW